MKTKIEKIIITSDAEIDNLTGMLKAVKNPTIRDIGLNFVESIKDINVMIELPRIIVMHSIVHSDTLNESLKKCSKYAKEHNIEKFEDFKTLDEVDAFFEGLKTELNNNITLTPEEIKHRHNQLVTPFGLFWANFELGRILELHEQHKKSFFTMVHSAVVWMWTLFEVAASELWETTLNEAFDTLGRDALTRFANKGETVSFGDKMTSKSIRLDHLAIFDYNIRGNVGSILKRYFDFSSLSGIETAYRFLFPKSITVQKSFNRTTLKLLAELTFPRN